MHNPLTIAATFLSLLFLTIAPPVIWVAGIVNGSEWVNPVGIVWAIVWPISLVFICRKLA